MNWQSASEKIGDLILRFRFREAQLEAMNIARKGNKYLTEEEPWKLQKTDPARVEVNHAPRMPSGRKLRRPVSHLFFPAQRQNFPLHLGWQDLKWHDASPALVKPGTILGDLPILFSKVDDETVEAEMAKLGNKDAELNRDDNTDKKLNIMPQKDQTTFDNFTSMDLRVATVTECIPVEKTKKLLQLTVDTGLRHKDCGLWDCRAFYA